MSNAHGSRCKTLRLSSPSRDSREVTDIVWEMNMILPVSYIHRPCESMNDLLLRTWVYSGVRLDAGIEHGTYQLVRLEVP